MNIDKSLEDVRAAAQNDIRDLRGKITELDKDSLDLILTKARSHYAWQDRPVPKSLLVDIFDIMKMGSTSMNCCPIRITFVVDDVAKQRIAKSLKPANVPKVMSAPVTAILAYDTEFWRELLRLFPHEDRRGHFSEKPEHAEDTAYRNSTLQGAYFMIAARALGLDVGPISGFDNAVIDEEFFAGTTLRSNFLCNLGYGDVDALFQRLPRFDFDDVCEVL
jgi:3-hydroxypropanoate dehydrogenase